MNKNNEWYNPVVILKPGIQHLLNQITNGFVIELQQSILKTKIGFINDDRPGLIKTPEADLATNEIYFQDIHLSFLWCCSYATVTINSMYYEKAGETNDDIITFADRQESAKADLTMSWARSLINEVTWWPKDAARPDHPDKWTEAANNLHQACVVYLLLHEIGHLILHQGLKELMAEKKRNPFFELTEEDRQRIFDAEKEADRFALEQLMSITATEEIRLMKFLGAIMAQLSNFYLLPTADTRGGGTHPDLDDRLRAVINAAEFTSEANKIQFQAHVSVGIQLFLAMMERPYIPENPEKAKFKDFELLEDHLFGLIREMKEAARAR